MEGRVEVAQRLDEEGESTALKHDSFEVRNMPDLAASILKWLKNASSVRGGKASGLS